MKNISLALTVLLAIFALVSGFAGTAEATPDVIWTRSFGGTFSEARSVQQTRDGGHIVAGLTIDSASLKELDEFAWVVKLNAIGGIEWQKSLGETEYSVGADSIQQTSDGGYIVAGRAGRRNLTSWGTSPFATTHG